MIPRRSLVLALFAVAVLAAEARSHFLFIKVGPMAEGGRSAEVYFSEFAEAGDPRFIAKVAAGTTTRIQTSRGKIEPLNVQTARDRLRVPVPASGGMTVYADCVYGVLANRETPFLLRHYAKGIAGTPEEINGLDPVIGTPLEIAPQVIDGGKAIRLVAHQDRKPLGNVTFTTIDADLINTTIKSDAEGAITWTPPTPGRYSVTVRRDTKVKGEHKGKPYEEIRDFATIAFDWPLAPTGADPEAVSLFEQAVAYRAQWGADFPGFKADLAGVLDGRTFTGKLVVDPEGGVKVESDDETALPWLREQLGSLAMHRRGNPGKPESRPVVRFADADEIHPLGRLLAFEGGRFASSYRVKDGRISTVNRHIGKFNVTIATLEEERTPEGKSLPRAYVVQYWDDHTGALDRAETVRNRWVRVGKWDLPAEHVVASASGSGFSTKSVTISDHKPASSGR